MFKTIKNKAVILIGLLTIAFNSEAFCSNLPEYLELSNEGKCFITLHDQALTLDFRSKSDKPGASTNLVDIEIKIKDWLRAKDITENQIQVVHIHHLITRDLDFIKIFADGIIELDLSSSKTGISMWNVARSTRFPLLKKIDIRNNHTSYGKGVLRTALSNMPNLEEIILSNDDIKYTINKEEGLDETSFIKEAIPNSIATIFKRKNCLSSMPIRDDESAPLLCTSLVESKARHFLSLSYWFGTSEANKEN